MGKACRPREAPRPLKPVCFFVSLTGEAPALKAARYKAGSQAVKTSDDAAGLRTAVEQTLAKAVQVRGTLSARLDTCWPVRVDWCRGFCTRRGVL
jgi:hypothetical protein